MHKTFAVSLLVTLLAAAGLASGQTTDETGLTEISSAMVESRIEQVQASSAYDEMTRDSALDYYRRALTSLEAARVQGETATGFEQAITEAPTEAERLRSELADKRNTDPLANLDVGQDSAAREIERQLQHERTNEAAVRAQVATLEQELASEDSRPQATRERLTAANEELRSAIDRLALPPAADEPDIVQEARRWARQSAVAALRTEMHMLDKELLSHPVRVVLLQAQLDDVATNLDQVQARVRALRTLLSERRRDETEQVLAELDLEFLGPAATHPLVERIIQEDQALADALQGLSQTIEQLATSNGLASGQLEELRQRHQSTRQRLEVAGMGQALGRYLSEERRELSTLSDFRRESKLREDQIAEASIRNIRLLDQWQDVSDVNNFVEAQLAPVPEEVAEVLRPALLQLAQSRSGLLQQAIEQNGNYVRLLADNEYSQNQLFYVVTEYSDFLAERLLWVRSRNAFDWSDFVVLPGELLDFLSPGRWVDAANVFSYRLSHSPLQIGAILILLLFQWQRGRLRGHLKATSIKVGKPSEDSFAFTAKAVTLTLLITLPWPLFTMVTGYELTTSPQATAASHAVGEGLLLLTPLLFFLQAFRFLCTPGGVAEGHFRWAEGGVKRLRRQLDMLMLVLLLPAFVIVVNRGFQEYAFPGGAIQVMFVILAGGLTVFLHRLLRPRTGIAEALRRRPSDEPVLAFPWLWIGIATLIPLAVGVMALAGFLYSAGTMLAKLVNTMWLMFGLAILRELIVRWLLVIKRRLLLREALQRREVARAAREAGGEPATSDEHGSIAENPEEDIASLDADTRKLVNVGLVIAAILGVAGIWSSVLPALGIFKEITLWHYVASVGGQDALQSVTLIDLLIAIMVVVVTIVASSNIPSLIEIILRQKPSIKPGSRLAFATLARYTIAAVGIGATFSIIGVNWSKLQWLVAALGVGIGFGLQEIVANFISGLIILMERPIRVGDVVTVGEISGSVSRVQIRATTIRTWDRQELLVPNKEFITGRVLNWSLSDEVVRIHFDVGIAYGSDVEKALKLINEAADEHPDVLADPAPLVTFEQFGDNSLNLGVRCFVQTLEIRLKTLTDLHRAINRKFNEAGIVIAFPQRDLHLDTNSPLEVRILDGAPLEP